MQKFCKDGMNLGVFLKRGRSCKQRQGEHWKTMSKNLADLVFKKCKIVQELTSKKMHEIETVITQYLTLIFT